MLYCFFLIILMNRLPVLLLLVLGLSACGSTQTNTAPAGSKIQDLIIGKWRLTETNKRRTKDGPLEVVPVIDSTNMYVEYFKDNTFLNTSLITSLDDREKPSDAIKNGKWRVLSDETIEITYDYCQTRTEPVEKCEKNTDTIKIIFPDSDTLLDFGRIARTDVGTYSEYVEKFDTYKRKKY